MVSTTDDEFHGIYKDVKFNITEIRDCFISTKYGYSHSVWNGIIIDMCINKFTNSEIYVFPNSKHNIKTLIGNIFIFCLGCFNIYLGLKFYVMKALLCGVIIILSHILYVIFNEFKKVKLEDIDFSKEYYVTDRKSTRLNSSH